MFNLIKKGLVLFLATIANSENLVTNSKNCLLLNDQKCDVKKVIVDNDYMTFPYKIKVDRCIGSCNNIINPYSKVCVPDIVKNISVKVFDLISQQNKLRNIEFHERCKCDCLLNETVCNDEHRWNKDECKCESLKIENCDIGFSWNFNSCECEKSKKAAKLIVEEECDEITGIRQNKTVFITKYVENCKPFVASSIFFVSVSIILTGIMIYFHCKLKNRDILPY